MAETIQLDIVTPYGLAYSGEVSEVTAVAGEGEIGVLPGHTSLITTLKAGMLTFKNGKETLWFFVSGGYAEIISDRITILADSAERAESIDVERAKAAIRRAEERLKQAEKIDFARVTAAIERATIRMQVAEKRTAK